MTTVVPAVTMETDPDSSSIDPSTLCKSSSDDMYALYRKKMKEIMFLYCALLNGWQIHMLDNKTFKFSRPM